MIKTIMSSKMPVDELLRIRKNSVRCTGSKKRFCIVTGTHGDELEGQYVCFLLSKLFAEHKDKLRANVDIYPAINPLGIDSITRGIPNFDLDMNRIFPGDENGSIAEITARKIIDDIAGADMVIDIHSSNIFLREVPQARINAQCADKLVPYAKLLNIDFIWIHEAATVLEATLAHSLNSIGTPTIVVEMGVGMRINRGYCERLAAGILNLMKKMGMWAGEIGFASKISSPEISSNGEVEFINAKASGIFVHSIDHSDEVGKGSVIGKIVEPLTGKVLHTVTSSEDGFLFTLRAYPVVYEGSLLARIYRRKAK